jgi:CRISPR-associated protein Cas2
MPRSPEPLSVYRSMWLFALFDLPVDTKEAKKIYTQFRKRLLDLGFVQMQYSVYARFLRSEDASDSIRAQIRTMLPRRGHVRLLLITDRQFQKMEVFYGQRPHATEKPPDQFTLF